jgi:glycosyltransferase involved in cell wall biosynthesis
VEARRASRFAEEALIVPTPLFVSIIVPCYNHAALLPEALDSALAQTYKHREIIVIDDGSTDDVASVVRAYGSTIRYVRQENRGLAAARNAAIDQAAGEVIGLLDADDKWLPDKLEQEIPLFDDGAVGVVHGSYRKFPSSHPRSGVVWKGKRSTTGFHELLAFNSVGAPVSALFRRSTFERVGRFDTSLKGAEDWDLWIRLAAVSRVIGSDAVTAEYRLGDTSMSRNYALMYRCLNQVIDKHRRDHDRCAACQHAVRRARRHARAYYCDMAAREALRERAAGNYVRYLTLRTRGVLRNPRILRNLAHRLSSPFSRPAVS